MTESPLFDYYSKKWRMLSRIYQDKKANGYKITSKKMFKVEVDIMTDVIQSSILKVFCPVCL
jgi:phage major head subunit gpT-like protein